MAESSVRPKKLSGPYSWADLMVEGVVSGSLLRWHDNNGLVQRGRRGGP
jgi:hypothetical protein